MLRISKCQTVRLLIDFLGLRLWHVLFAGGNQVTKVRLSIDARSKPTVSPDALLPVE